MTGCIQSTMQKNPAWHTLHRSIQHRHCLSCTTFTSLSPHPQHNNDVMTLKTIQMLNKYLVATLNVISWEIRNFISQMQVKHLKMSSLPCCGVYLVSVLAPVTWIYLGFCSGDGVKNCMLGSFISYYYVHISKLLFLTILSLLILCIQISEILG